MMADAQDDHAGGIWQIHNPADGPRPIPENMVPWTQNKINILCKNPNQKIAAEHALKMRNDTLLSMILDQTDWPDSAPMTHDEVFDLSNQVDRIQNQDTRERAYRALRDRDRDAVNRLLKEED